MAAPRPARSKVGVQAPWWFVLPALVMFAFIVVVPSLRGSLFAFTDWDGITPGPEVVGLDNFTRIPGDSAARQSILNTLFFALAITVLQNLAGLLLALGLNTRIKSRNWLRVVFFAPAVITPMVVAFLWQYILAPDGPLNSLLTGVGLPFLAQDWLGDSALARWTIVGVLCWQHVGYSMVIFLAGLQGVPPEVLEAAEIDGASAVRKFWHITRPLLAPAITINVMLSVIGGLKLFDQILVMTQGGPGSATETLSTVVYKDAFQYGDFGYAVALALVLTVFVAVISTLQFGLLRRRETV